MAKSLFLSREVKVYVEFDGKFWEMPVLDGFSFSQGTNTTEVTIAEMADSSNNSRRGRIAFNDSLNPVEWSFSTYARPTVVNTKHRAPEEVLWAMMAGASNYDGTEAVNIFDDGATTPVPVVKTTSTTSLDINFDGSNKLEFGAANIYFGFPSNDGSATDADVYYKCTGSVVNEASLSFDLDGITTIEWSGMATKLTEGTVPDFGTSNVNLVQHGLNSTSNFIRNRLTQLTLSTADNHLTTDADNNIDAYSLVLTGGNISISNNISFITPSSLGVVNTPLGHVSGTRSVSGSFSCYLSGDTRGSAELMEDLLNASTIVQNQFSLQFNVGGVSNPKLEIACPHAMLEIPSHSVEDVISVEVNFHGLPADIADTDEVTVKYFGS